MTTPLFLLRCTELGLSMEDLELLSIGMVSDMVAEKQRDGMKFPDKPLQKDFDAF